MSYVTEFSRLPLADLTAEAENAGAADVEKALERDRRTIEDFTALISPCAAQPQYLEAMARQSHNLTLKYFGRVIRLFAPLYLSNECVNRCQYCGFSRQNSILRVTLTLEQVFSEAKYLHKEGFRHILLVAGEHPRFVSPGFLADCVSGLHPDWPSISLEVGPLETDQYRPIVEAGAEGLVIYQETYDRSVYAIMHQGGPKKNFEWRLETPERAYAAGFKRLGVGALLGLAPWRQEAISLANHLEYLFRHCWKAQLTVSIPRLRPAAGSFQPPVLVEERDLVQLVCALRLLFPELGIVLSTRERSRFRDGLVPLGITMMSAGSHTEPGGYTGQGKESLHLAKKRNDGSSLLPVIRSEGEHATEQFEVADDRSPEEVTTVLAGMGYDPVWKDWDVVLNEN